MSTFKEKSPVDASLTALAATAASNIQIATNAVIKFASDIGALVELVTASNFATKILDVSKLLNTKVKATAFRAETASKYAMDMSAALAENSSSSELAESSTTETKELVRKLINCADLTIKLEEQISRTATVNSRLTDEVVMTIQQAETSSQHAVSLAITALQSCYAVTAALPMGK